MKRRSFLIFLLILTLCFSCLHGCSFGNDPENNPTATTTGAETPINHGTDNNYEYDEYEDHIILTACLTDSRVIWVPDKINRKPVVGFGTIFAKNFKLTTINIPGSVQSIDERAFYMCDHLSTVNISNGLKTIGKEAFSGCSSLSVAKIPASVTSIADDAFLYCMNLVIFGEEGSTAQKFADRFQSINFRIVEPETTEAAEEDSSAAEPEETSETTPVKETTTKMETTAPPATEAPTEPPTEPPTQAPTEPPATEEQTTIPDDSLDV